MSKKDVIWLIVYLVFIVVIIGKSVTFTPRLAKDGKPYTVSDGD